MWGAVTHTHLDDSRTKKNSHDDIKSLPCAELVVIATNNCDKSTKPAKGIVLGPSEVTQSSKVVGSRSVPWKLADQETKRVAHYQAQRLMWGIQNPGQTKILSLLLDNLHLKQINRRSCLPKIFRSQRGLQAPERLWGQRSEHFILVLVVSTHLGKQQSESHLPGASSWCGTFHRNNQQKWRLFCLTWSSRKKPKAWNGMHHVSSWASCNFPANRIVSRLHLQLFSLHDLEVVSGFFVITSQCTKACASWISPERNGFDGLKDKKNNSLHFCSDSDRSMLLLFPKQITQSSYERALAYPTSLSHETFWIATRGFVGNSSWLCQLPWASNTKHASNGQAQQDQQHHQMDLVCIALLALQGLNESKNLVRHSGRQIDKRIIKNTIILL